MIRRDGRVNPNRRLNAIGRADEVVRVTQVTRQKAAPSRKDRLVGGEVRCNIAADRGESGARDTRIEPGVNDFP